ncbi:unnamed protein product [Amoebophrya sp. A25]|nr:unnamed protein product [Amoebophrya sp. A25]CAD7967389.1 unnamed protein product [Amoebophrya sp. A25]CAD7976809.1 unnamed protein product [Amoebophrya sp. A25]|eukprot:GSA25T00027639001.1
MLTHIQVISWPTENPGCVEDPSRNLDARRGVAVIAMLYAAGVLNDQRPGYANAMAEVGEALFHGGASDVMRFLDILLDYTPGSYF